VIECAGQHRDRPPEPWTQRIVGYIDEHIGEPLAVGDLARAASLSESQFKHRFKAEVGVSPRDYVLRRKVSAARELLAQGELVTTVANRLGFSSSQYFATVFRRYTRMSPTESRRASERRRG
jgi:AraC-like DNA-binding protein